jgi:hypothetical protein
MDTHAYRSLYCELMIRCLEMMLLYIVKSCINGCVIINAALIWYVGLKMQRVSLFGRIVNISLLGERAVLRRKVFTMEGPQKGNGVRCIRVGNREHDEVTN